MIQTRARLLMAVSTALVTSALLFAGSPPRQGSERSVLVTVLDEKGAPIRDLTAQEFLVREDNTNRTVVGAALATEPLFVQLLIDTTQPRTGTQAATQELRTSLVNFAKTVQAASPDTQISVMEFGGAAQTTVNFTTKTDDLEKTLKRIYPAQRTSGVLLEALVESAKALSKKASPRRAMVVVSLGSTESSTMEPRVVAEAVQKSGAAFWAVTIQPTGDATSFQTGNNASDNAMSPLREVLFANLPQLTGGLRYSGVTATSLDSMLKKVADALVSQYLVTYTSVPGPAAKQVQATATRGAKALTSSWVK